MLRRFLKARSEPANFAALRRIDLFHALNRRELRTLDSLLHHRSYCQDEIIFDEGEDGQAVYFILSGHVLISRQSRPVDGAIAELGPDQSFGEMAMLDDAPRMAQARARDDCRLAVLFRDDFLGLLQSHALIASKLSLALAHMLARRLRDTISRDVV